ncbi:MAG: hypothetical protein WDZ80_00390 [Candidatus Paceibacterota bacterium]
MKSLTNILRRSNITPFERVTALVYNDVHREKTGKDRISKSDLHALSKGWSPSASEANEYNKYINIVQLEGTMKMDVQMFLSRSEVSILRNQRVLDYFISNARMLKKIPNREFAKGISNEDGVQFLIQHTYLEYEKVLHTLTFYNLPEEIQNDLLILDAEVISDGRYLADQIFLYELFSKGIELTKQDKNLIINRIYSRMYYEGAKKIKKSTAEKYGFLLHTSFAELPVKDLFQKLADEYRSVLSKDDDTEESLLSAVEEYAESKNMSIEQLVKEGLLSWIDNGLFTKEYAPLFMSKRFDTWNGNTTKNHKELFMAWYTEFEKSKNYLQKLFDTGKIKRQTIKKDFLDMSRTREVITGTSLYSCTEDAEFVKEYKKQIEVLMPVSKMFLFIKKNATPVMNYKTLCEFKNLAQKISSVFDIDMTEGYGNFIKLYEEEVRFLNLSLSRIPDIVMEHLYTEKTFKYIIDINDECFEFDLESKSKLADIVKMYSEEFNKLRI